MTTTAAATQDGPVDFRAHLEHLIETIRPVISTGNLTPDLRRLEARAAKEGACVQLVPHEERFNLTPKGYDALPGIADAIEDVAYELDKEEDVRYSGPVWAVDAHRTLVVAATALRRAAMVSVNGYEVAVSVEHLLRNALERIPPTTAA